MRFSIVTPSFNQVQFLGKTIESIWKQRGNFEIEHIIVDGGSTDGSVELIREYEEKLRRGEYAGYCNNLQLKWRSQSDNGQSEALNAGLGRATGEILAYLNSDDLYEPRALQEVQKTFIRFPALHWAYGRCRIVDEQGKEIQRFIKWYRTLLGRFYSRNMLLVVNTVPQPATFWKTSAAKIVGPFSEREDLCMDYDYWCRLSERFPARQIPKTIASFRVHSVSKGGTRFIQQFNDEYRIAVGHTANRLLLWLHRIHMKLVVMVYSRMRPSSARAI